MNDDFGMLVDFLRGELDKGSSAKVRSRLEHDAAYFGQFQRLKRTYAVLRSLPCVRPAADVALAHDDFAAAVRREFEARDWLSLLPWIDGREEFLRGLRTEFMVRALVGGIPRLQPSRSFVNALRAQFAACARTVALPLIKVRPEWIRNLRNRFVAMATHERLPAVPVRDGFRRRLQVALFEATRELEPAAKSPLPEVEPRDPFRRRLFKHLLFSSRRRVRDEPRRADTSEYQVGRELGRGWRQSQRSMIITMSAHALVIVLTLFMFSQPGLITGESVIEIGGRGEFALQPPLPGTRNEGFPFADDVGRGGLPGGAFWPADGFSFDDSEEYDMPLYVPEYEDRVEEMPRPQEGTLGMEFGGPQRASRPVVHSLFRLRTAPREQKAGFVGREDLLPVLDNALRILRVHQHAEGYWKLIEVDVEPQSLELREIQRLEMTSAALLAFLGDGHSSQAGFSGNVRLGLSWLISRQRESGQIGPPELGNVQVHAMATLVLAEEFGLTRDTDLREPLRKACRWLCEVKAANSGGFPFKANDEASMTTSVWAYMALVTARNVRVPPVDLPKKRIDAFLGWYGDYWKYSTRVTDRQDIHAKSDLLPTAAAGALNLFATEAGNDFEQTRLALLERISREMPDLHAGRERDNADMRYLFFGSLMMALHQQAGGERDSRWSDELARTLIENQREDGSFKPVDDYGSLYGTVYSTALAALSIENAYRVNLLTQD